MGLALEKRFVKDGFKSKFSSGQQEFEQMSILKFEAHRAMAAAAADYHYLGHAYGALREFFRLVSPILWSKQYFELSEELQEIERQLWFLKGEIAEDAKSGLEVSDAVLGESQKVYSQLSRFFTKLLEARQSVGAGFEMIGGGKQDDF